MAETLKDMVFRYLKDFGEDIWTPNEIEDAIAEALNDYSKINPSIVVDDTLVTVADSRLVDISGLSNLLYGYKKESFDPVYGVEYPTDEFPRKYRNFRVIGTDLDMQIATAPSEADEEVIVTYYAAHDETTLPSVDQRLVIKLAAANAAINKPLHWLNEWLALSTRFDAITTALGNTTQLISDALTDIDSGRTLLTTGAGEEVTDAVDRAITAIENAITFFNKSNVGQPESDYLQAAITELRVASTELGNAGGFRNLSSGQMEAVSANINKANGYVTYIKVKMSEINMANTYTSWGERLKASLQKDLLACGMTVGQERPRGRA